MNSHPKNLRVDGQLPDEACFFDKVTQMIEHLGDGDGVGDILVVAGRRIENLCARTHEKGLAPGLLPDKVEFFGLIFIHALRGDEHQGRAGHGRVHRQGIGSGSFREQRPGRRRCG